MSADPILDPARQAQARVYARLRLWIWVGQRLAGAAYLLLWIVLGWSQSVRNALTPSDPQGAWAMIIPWWMTLVLTAAAVEIPWVVLNLPLDFYAGFALPHRFGLSTQSRRDWVVDLIKGGLVSTSTGIPLLIGLYFCIRVSPQVWWLWAGLGYTLLSVVLTAVAPLTLMPLFYRIKPLADEHALLARRLISLADRAGTRVRGVFAFDLSRRTRAANAALVGLGRTRRVLLGDTLLTEFSEDEIETVLAHELAHHAHGDIPLGLLVGGVASVGMFAVVGQVYTRLAAIQGLAGLADPAGLPAIALLLGTVSLLLAPLRNAYSRWRESLADAFALRLTGNPQAFASAMIRVANQNLAEVDPPRWVILLFYEHPPLRARIERAGQQPADPGSASASDRRR